MIQRATNTHQLGPGDHGRRMTYEEYLAGDYQPGYKYELIDGELWVSPEPNFDHEWFQTWLEDRLKDYARDRPDIIAHVAHQARIWVPGRRGVTTPEPDLAVYDTYPKKRPWPRGSVRWENINPFLVAEVVSPDNAKKDLERNVDLYWHVPSIKEYWIFDDLHDNVEHPLTVYRRQARRWKIISVGYGEPYSTRLLPGFELIVDPLQGE